MGLFYEAARSTGAPDVNTDVLMQSAKQAASDAMTSIEAFLSWLVAQGPEKALAIAVFIGLFLLLRIVRGAACGLLRSRKHPSHAARNVASGVFGATSSFFLLAASASLVAPFAPDLPARAQALIETVFAVALIVQGAIWIRTLITAISTGYLENHPSVEGGPGSTAATLVKSMSGIAIWAIAAVMILTNLGFEVGPLIAGLGVGGLAIGLAAQSLFRDLFSALAIIFDRPFVRGDFIIFNDGDYMGDVEKIGMKTTRLRSLSGEQIIIANSQLLDKEIRNFRRMNRRRAQFDVGVVYSTPHEALETIPGLIEQAIDAVDGVSFERSNFKAFGDSALVFETVFWVEDKDYAAFMKRQEAVLLGVHRAFEDKGLEFAFPTQTVRLVR